jgi:enoyl-CoA hydratase
MTLDVERRGKVTVLTLQRPERRNALTHRTLEEFMEALADDDPMVVVITGSEGHFCAGADLSTVEDTTFTDLLHTMLDRIRTGPWVSIAAISGAAMGGGVQLAIACDLRVGDESVRFAIPAGKLGLMIDHWTVARLTGIVGQGTGRAILLGGADIRFEEAQRVGLIQRVGGLDDALAWADEITRLAPLSVLGHKISLNATEDVAFKEETSVAFRRAWDSADLQEGLAAFREKRTPRFEGR